jgi:aspartyl-tRNA(Asn)/glutamyl-tRNA(Gln) amidotransferase subunit A
MKIFVEDTIMQKGEPVTAGSKILESFVSPITATVVERALASGYEIAGRVKPTEFCLGKMSENGGLPAFDDLVESCDFFLGNDLFGEYRRWAVKNGMCYIHPTYGTVSRFGLVPVVQSMDAVGVMCKDIPSGLSLLSKVAGKDEKDGAMITEIRGQRSEGGEKIRVGVVSGVGDLLPAAFEKAAVELPYFDVYEQVMTILSTAEVSNNISRYDGIKFGYRAADFRGVEDLYVKTRSQGLGIEAKFAAIMGGLVLSQDNYEKYYDKAMRVRRLIKESVKFDGYDVLALPCDLSSTYLAGLAGLPACSFAVNGEGIQFVAAPCNEEIFEKLWEASKWARFTNS